MFFTRTDNLLTRVIAIVMCLSVRLSVTSRYCVTDDDTSVPNAVS